ncbi:energy-coupling factor ABC transporter ATP-binding protein [bacterium]|nr:energy-coupling factor ABC transporter ATP-binding protein [bacterium]
MPEPAIAINDFSHIYEDGTVALSHVTLSIEAGESVGIIGHNGSGKSTLFMNIVGILGPDARITVDGIPVTKQNLREIRRKVGFVFNDPRDQLFMSKVIEDVAFGPLNTGLPRQDALKAAEHALGMVGLSGFDDRISYHLSGGEMQRAAIATVLAMSPEIIVMDEPSAGLDPRAKRELTAVLRNLTCTKLIASHDLEFICNCTERVVLLHNGSIAVDGPCREIIGNTELLMKHGL